MAMGRHRSYALRIGVLLLVVGILGGRSAMVAFAAPIIPSAAPISEDCNPCVTVTDTAAWDQNVSVVDKDAWDEPFTITDVPARTATRTGVDIPAHSVSHHYLVTPETTLARQVVDVPAHYDPVPP